jgi:hypothetical protein
MDEDVAEGDDAFVLADSLGEWGVSLGQSR